MPLDFLKKEADAIQTVLLVLMFTMILILCSYCVMLQGDPQDPEPANSVAFGS